MASKFLAREHIAQVNLDERQRDPEKGVAQGNAGVRVSPRIDDDKGNTFALGRMDLPDQFMLGVALKGDQLMALGHGQRLELGLDDLQSRGSVDSRLARAEKIQIRTIQQQNSSHLALSPAPSRCKGPR